MRLTQWFVERRLRKIMSGFLHEELPRLLLWLRVTSAYGRHRVAASICSYPWLAEFHWYQRLMPSYWVAKSFRRITRLSPQRQQRLRALLCEEVAREGTLSQHDGMKLRAILVAGPGCNYERVFGDDFFSVDPEEIMEVYDEICCCGSAPLKPAADRPGTSAPGATRMDERALNRYMMSVELTDAIRNELRRPMREYSKAIEECPSPEAYWIRGVAWCRWGRYKKGMDDFSMALGLNPTFSPALAYRGNTHLTLGEYDEAIEDLTAAIEIDPDSSDAYVSRAAAWGAKGEYDRVIQDCSRAIELQPGYAVAYQNRGGALCMMGENEKAITDFTKAIELSPKLIKAYAGRAMAFASAGNADACKRDLEMVAGLDPSSIVISSLSKAHPWLVGLGQK